jgi:rhodanese-related sulfurtransferase
MNRNAHRCRYRGLTSAIPATVFAAALMVVGSVSMAAESTTPGQKPAVSTTQLPKGKQTTLGLYVTAAQAYDMWKAAPDKVKLIDVRTPEEYAFIGHAEKAWNIPYAFVTYSRKDGKTEYGPKRNPAFVDEVKRFTRPGDTLLVMCRSGDRSAKAVDLLAAAGIKDVYSVIDGVEGDKVTDPDSVFVGKRMKNGWKNSAPWVYTLDPEKIILEEGVAK